MWVASRLKASEAEVACPPSCGSRLGRRSSPELTGFSRPAVRPLHLVLCPWAVGSRPSRMPSARPAGLIPQTYFSAAGKRKLCFERPCGLVMPPATRRVLRSSVLGPQLHLQKPLYSSGQVNTGGGGVCAPGPRIMGPSQNPAFWQIPPTHMPPF